jgi:hypothetical protein
VFGNDTLKLYPRVTSHYNAYDIFVLKYNPAGNILWVKSFGGNDVDYLDAMDISNDNIILSGYFRQDTLIFGFDMLINKNGNDLPFMGKLNSQGKSLWGKKPKFKIGCNGVTIAVSSFSDGSEYFSGYMFQQNQIRVDSFCFDTTTIVVPSNTQNVEIFLAKINAQTGAFINDVPLQKSNAILFPNPFSNSSTLKINSSQTLTNAQLSVVDLLGREVQSITNIHSNEIKIERNNLPSGIYFYHLIQNGMTICNGKMVVE